MRNFLKIKNIIPTILAVAIVAVSLAFYSENISNDLDSLVENTLSELSNQQSFIIDDYMIGTTSLLGDLSYSLEFQDAVIMDTPVDMLNYLLSLEVGSWFEYITVVLADGTGIKSNGEIVDYSNGDFFKQILNPRVIFSGIEPSSERIGSSVYMSMPLFKDGQEVSGVIIAEITSENLENLLVSNYNGRGLTAILDQNGNVIAATDNTYGVETGENISIILNEDDYKQQITTSQLFTILETSKNSDILAYEVNEQQMRFNHQPILNTNWTLLVSVPEDLISSGANGVIFNTILLFIEMMSIVIIIWLRLIWLRRKSVQLIQQAAYYDELTGIINEKKFKIEARKILKSNKGTKYSIFKFDIVNFKVINKLFDYRIGDEVIKSIATMSISLTDSFDKDFLFARLNADEFLVFGKDQDLLTLANGKFEFEELIKDKMFEICSRPIKFRYSSYSIPIEETDINKILDTIVLTHNYHKRVSFDGVFDYDENLKDKLNHTNFICDNMRDALNNNEYQVYLQPKNCLNDNNKICGAEALVRWHRPNGDIIFPNNFISIFEQEGFVVELDDYMLNNVCKIIKRFCDSGHKNIPISVNFSRLHMLNLNFVKELTEIVDYYEIPRHLLEIEMTESSMIENSEVFKKVFADLHHKGFTVSMDDFGSGYSSLDLLAELNFDVLKLDRSLLEKSEDSEKKKCVLTSILTMAKSLNLKTVCEGVETIEHVDFLKNSGCDIAQGYFFSKPIHNKEFDRLLEMQKI